MQCIRHCAAQLFAAPIYASYGPRSLPDPTVASNPRGENVEYRSIVGRSGSLRWADGHRLEATFNIQRISAMLMNTIASMPRHAESLTMLDATP